MIERSISVIVIDHNHILLEGLSVLIRNEADMRLAGKGQTAHDAVALYRSLKPDFTVIDLDLPDDQAIYAVRQILSADPGARLIGLTTCELDRVGPHALGAGVLAVVPKDRIHDDLVCLIRKLADV